MDDKQLEEALRAADLGCGEGFLVLLGVLLRDYQDLGSGSRRLAGCEGNEG